jgi:hypothetical protein
LQLFRLYAAREFGLRPVTCLFFFFLIKHSMSCDLTTRMSSLMLISCDFIPNGLIFVCIISYFMFNLVEFVCPFYCLGLLAGLTCLTCLSWSHITHTVCLWRSHWACIILGSFPRDPYFNLGGLQHCVPSPPSCPVAMYVLKKTAQIQKSWRDLWIILYIYMYVTAEVHNSTTSKNASVLRTLKLCVKNFALLTSYFTEYQVIPWQLFEGT